jgi:allantoinase
MEEDAISLVARLSATYPKLRTHIVHLSASSALPILEEARETQKLPLSVETCIHYLTLSAEDVPEGRTDFKCCPPIRDNSNREELWKALQAGKIDFVVSDHSPCVAELKRLPTGDFMSAWGGIGGLGLGLPLMYTEACKRGIKLSELLQWMASKPAKQVGLEKQKGSLVVGADAAFVIFNANKKYTVSKPSPNE